MITKIRTCQFVTIDNAETKSESKQGILICINNEIIKIIDDYGFVIPHNELYSYLETSDIYLNNLKIGK